MKEQRKKNTFIHSSDKTYKRRDREIGQCMAFGCAHVLQSDQSGVNVEMGNDQAFVLRCVSHTAEHSTFVWCVCVCV